MLPVAHASPKKRHEKHLTLLRGQILNPQTKITKAADLSVYLEDGWF
jgi:hypothetical protein